VFDVAQLLLHRFPANSQIGGHHVRCSAREAARQLAKKPRRTVSVNMLQDAHHV
jgi:hypothetical protein